ncbi:DUF559 domain-containing protein [Stieleria bergensis]|uniref:DUF559 domain-containing protein n=1 Tax=Stieleria bergensis TaxID=2528025 RepID=UPI003AF40012
MSVFPMAPWYQRQGVISQSKICTLASLCTPRQALAKLRPSQREIRNDSLKLRLRMEPLSGAHQITQSSPAKVGSAQRRWRWDRVFSAEKMCLHCGEPFQPKVYRHADGTPRHCMSEGEWKRKMFCSPKCAGLAKRKPTDSQSKQVTWRELAEHQAIKHCECCDKMFRPWVKRNPKGEIVACMSRSAWRRQRFCSISCSRKVQNPMFDSQSRAKVSKTLKLINHKPPERGGNGQLTSSQRMLLQNLGADWIAEYPIPTSGYKASRLPNHIKIDVANPKLKLAIELDGRAHVATRTKRADKSKTRFLLCCGWSVLRLSNAKALSLCTTSRSADILRITLMEYFHTTVI